jgi:hypothetical protein
MQCATESVCLAYAACVCVCGLCDDGVCDDAKIALGNKCWLMDCPFHVLLVGERYVVGKVEMDVG